MENTQHTNDARQSLKDKLMAIILLETSKDYKEMDSDLVTECVDFLMELEEKRKLTQEEISQRVKNIPFRTKKFFRTKVLIAVAAVIAILFAVFAAVSVAISYDPNLSLLENISQLILDLKGGESVEVDGIITVKNNETRTYSTVEEFFEKEKADILYPTWLPDNSEITSVMFTNSDGLEYYIFQCETAVYSVSAAVNQSIHTELKNTLDCKKLNNFTLYYKYDDPLKIFEGYFEHGGMLYTTSAYSEDELFRIIENLKENE